MWSEFMWFCYSANRLFRNFACVIPAFSVAVQVAAEAFYVRVV